MTDQGKINREGATPASLFERADAAFGIGPVPTRAVPPVPQAPAALRRPAAPPPKSAPAATVAAAPHHEPAAAPQAPRPEPKVEFCGPFAAIDRDHLHDGGMIVPEDPVTCGNGSLDPGEACDDGAGNSDSVPDACRTDCTLPTCGEGTLDNGEACDAGALNSDGPQP